MKHKRYTEFNPYSSIAGGIIFIVIPIILKANGYNYFELNYKNIFMDISLISLGIIGLIYGIYVYQHLEKKLKGYPLSTL